MSWENIISGPAEFFGLDARNAIKGRSGPGKYEPTMTDKLFGVTEQELRFAGDELTDYEASNNPLVSERVGAGLDPRKSGETSQDYLSRTGKAWRAELANEAHNTPGKVDARDQRDIQFKYLQDQNQLSNRRLDTAESNRMLDRAEDRRSAQMARLDDLEFRRDQQADKMHIYEQQLSNQRADRKQAQMMALIQGLATLGSGFAL